MTAPGTLYDAFLDELRDTYHAEMQITRALPRMMKAASAPKLRATFKAHLRETRTQITRLETIFASVGEKARAKPCDGMTGILKEGAATMAENFDETTMDACLIAAAQRVEHYEMAAYGTLVAWSRVVGNKQASDLLQQTLLEEKAADLTLSSLAEAGINEQAADAAKAPQAKGRATAKAATKSARGR